MQGRPSAFSGVRQSLVSVSLTIKWDVRSWRAGSGAGGRDNGPSLPIPVFWCETFTPYAMVTRPMEDPPMPAVEKRTISLPPAQARYIDSLVETGTYASASEVVRAGLRALRERDAAVERWLKEDVVPVYDAMVADPGRALSADKVTAAMRAHHAEHLKKPGRGS